MHITTVLSGLLAAAGAARGLSHTATGTLAIESARATAKTESPTSNVKGKAFDRIMMIYLETTAYQDAIADDNCKALIDEGLLLTNMYGVGDPSQPAYVAAASGDDFGVNGDSFLLVNQNVSTIVDLLEDKGISWADYNQGIPYSGFDGFAYNNTVEGNYMRKHDLLMRFNSIANTDRTAQVKNFTLFYEDLENKRLPQWMFVTPNLYNDGHDTNITVSCNFTRTFVTDLLKNDYFNDNTLVYITWQANGEYSYQRNHVASIMLGSALPKSLVGKTDSAYYNHYSELASVEANWCTHTLGRWDVGANIWSWVGQKTGDAIRTWNANIAGGSFESYYWNQSYGGVFNSAKSTKHEYVKPSLNLNRNGRTVLPAIRSTWQNSNLPSYYANIIELPDAYHPPRGFGVPVPLAPAPPITTPITIYPVADRSNT